MTTAATCGVHATAAILLLGLLNLALARSVLARGSGLAGIARTRALAAATNVAGATRALEAVATAERNIARNVTPQLAIEVMLFDIRKALKCR